MTVQSGSGADDRMVVGYFADGADAYRAINELVDEGFSSSDIGAAFRTRRTGAEPSETESEEVAKGSDLTPAGDRNPAVTGSVGGPASHDQAVTPAGLAPGAGNAFPAASKPGPIPGGEVPATLPHDLPSTLAHDLPSTLQAEPPATEINATTGRRDEHWSGHLRTVFGGSQAMSSGKSAGASTKFGTGEGQLGLYSSHDYSEPAFEGSFVGMGLGSNEARSLSSGLARGGAVVSVRATGRASLAEAIIERNHGQIRFEKVASIQREADRESPVDVYGSMCSYYRPDEALRRRAS